MGSAMSTAMARVRPPRFRGRREARAGGWAWGDGGEILLEAVDAGRDPAGRGVGLSSNLVDAAGGQVLVAAGPS